MQFCELNCGLFSGIKAAFVFRDGSNLIIGEHPSEARHSVVPEPRELAVCNVVGSSSSDKRNLVFDVGEQTLKAHGITEEESVKAPVSPVHKLGPLAKAKIPLLHVVGAADTVVPVEENSAVIVERYRKLGGDIKVISKPGVGHHPHALKDPGPIVDFIRQHTTGC